MHEARRSEKPLTVLAQVIQGVFTLMAALLPIVSEPALSVAQPAPPHSASISITGLHEQMRITTLSREQISILPERSTIPAVRIKTRIRGQGLLDARFTTRRNKTWQSYTRTEGKIVADSIIPLLLQGTISIGGTLGHGASTRSFPAALSVINNKLRITFLGRPIGSKKRQRLYTIHTHLSERSTFNAHVKSIPSSAFRRGRCDSSVESVTGARHAEQDSVIQSASYVSSQSASEGLVITLSTDADPEWFRYYGAESNAKIAEIINQAESIYSTNFRISFRIVKQHVYTDTSPYTSTDPNSLLSQFVINPANAENLSVNPTTFAQDVNVKHLFSGKDFNGNALGIAYIGTLCASPGLAYGATRRYLSDATFGIFAHEVGHNLGAFHDVQRPGTIMYPTISLPPATNFSRQSFLEIIGFLGTHSWCLSSELRAPPTIPPSPTTIPAEPQSDVTIRQRLLRRSRPTIRFSGHLTNNSEVPAWGVPIQLIRNGALLATTETDSDGRYSFLFKAKSFARKPSVVYVSTEDGKTSSSIVKVKAFMWRDTQAAR